MSNKSRDRRSREGKQRSPQISQRLEVKVEDEVGGKKVSGNKVSGNEVTQVGGNKMGGNKLFRLLRLLRLTHLVHERQGQPAN